MHWKLQKIWIFDIQSSIATCLRWGGYYCVHFVANFTSFPVVQNPLRFDEVTESLKVETFFETQCIYGPKTNCPFFGPSRILPCASAMLARQDIILSASVRVRINVFICVRTITEKKLLIRKWYNLYVMMPQKWLYYGDIWPQRLTLRENCL